MLFSVAVDSRDRTADYSALYIVVASNTMEAKDVAETHVESVLNREILSSEAYPLTLDTPRILGRMLDTDEE